MAKKNTIGLGLFFNNETNSGIVNYIYNIVSALNTLPIDRQPYIVLIYNDDAPIDYIKSIGYRKIKTKYFKTFPKNRILKILNNLMIKVSGYNCYVRVNYFLQIDCFYPYFPFLNKEFQSYNNSIEWLVDFNNKAFPEFYKDAGALINKYQLETTKKFSTIILSSNTLKNELEMYYPNYRNNVKILSFACTLPNFDDVDVNELKKKYGINVKYFMSPNQFWEHKNQIVVFKAIQVWRHKFPNLKFKVLFTGSPEVNRGKGKYSDILLNYVKENNLEEYVLFLGILDRKEQIALMKNSVALIQPSLYEGWSTLVEEAKALNKYILVSDIPVHKEQITRNMKFFNPQDHNELFEDMSSVYNNSPQLENFNYRENILDFGEAILDTLLND